MVLCTLPDDFEGNRELHVESTSRRSTASLRRSCQAFIAYGIYCKANQNWPLRLWSATNFRKRSTELLSEIIFSALHGLLTAQFNVAFFFFFHSGFKSQCSFRVNKHGTLPCINGFGLRPGAIQCLMITCSSHTFKKQKTKVIFLLEQQFFFKEHSYLPTSWNQLLSHWGERVIFTGKIPSLDGWF